MRLSFVPLALTLVFLYVAVLASCGSNPKDDGCQFYGPLCNDR